MGGFEASEEDEDVSLHLLGKVGKCILQKDGWRTESAVPGGTRCKYKVWGAALRQRHGCDDVRPVQLVASKLTCAAVKRTGQPLKMD